MRKLLYALTAIMLLGVPWAHAAGPEFRSDHPERYTVVKGDTLWDISSRFLNNPWYWPEIWHVNPQVSNPHLIYPGDQLALVYIDGKQRVTKVSGGNGVTKLSPSVRSTPIDTPVPAIPLDAISSFLTDTRIVDPAVLEAAPYVLEGEDARIVTGAGDRIYARGEATHDTMGVFRRSVTYIDPDTQEFLGLEAKAIGAGEVLDTNGDVLTLELKRSKEEVRIGDRLLPTEDRKITSQFSPSAPNSDIDGKMIAVDGGVTQIGQYNVVVINRGAREGIEAGNVLAVFKAGSQARDPYTKEVIQLPAERAGLLMVFQVYEKVSYGLVLKATRTLSVGDQVKNP
ncbi:MAG: peptidoglycan-binding protein [Alteromonadaceae bacterium]|uniref:LysM peptidoglycan-binding domain-containing protein n=1 Tax=Marinobacter sp. BGYM27 TaxID=2975597 RepID=UPI000C4CC738|nr:LysM peptidoglycan-binding domain-containing protein [Marinobacter sp. BGYM27]MAA66019.1 peptidoglycan-binding protein [Alteromonadaceae bacterium]MBH86828.1 peptidoglycan-binding protein [Alteromonadaceae bacterium]MDG5501590.1 LysM peptidoglycan-binding domain-containing protein [Marinobacter sp. BGYM27]|tara:strand:- start:210 stop:1232 length:1023 start_codon:yes stop_codon:yes gene_type:complete